MNKNQGILVALAALVIVFLIVNVFLFFGPHTTNPNQPPVGNNPGGGTQKTELIWIVSNNCPDCFDIKQAKSIFADINYTETTLTFETDNQAKTLVGQYNIEAIPSLIVKPSTQDWATLNAGWLQQGFNWSNAGTIEDNNVLVLRQVPPPYLDVATKTVKGLVEMWGIAKTDCTDCTPPVQKGALESMGIKVTAEHQFEYGSADANALIAQYHITVLPALVLSSEISAYTQLVPSLETGGTFLPDGTWVLKSPPPYYWDLNLNRKVGGLSITHLTYADCNSCFAISELDSFLETQLNLKIAHDQNLDWGTPEGKAFARDYNISWIPTVVLGGDVFAYPSLSTDWSSFGFIAPDGNRVFASQNQFGPDYNYFDILSNSIKQGAASGS